MKIDIYWDEKYQSTKFALLEDVNINGYVVPAGFVSDGCSCPKVLWNYCEPISGKYIAAFLLHDWMYSTQAVTRKNADVMLRENLITAGMSTAKAYTIYAAVRTFGGSHWNK